MLKFFYAFTLWLVGRILRLRYKVKVVGLENLNPKNLRKPGGILFLPNHPTVFIDPYLVLEAVHSRYRVRPLIVEYMYYIPVVVSFMKYLRALPVPNFNTTSNSHKKMVGERAFTTVIDGLKKGDNFLIYPAGRLKHSGKEVIGGSSGVHRIITETPEANIVLVRTTGLWGSIFSKAWGSETPNLQKTIWEGLKIGLKNLIFFCPRREVVIEFQPAGPYFPYKASRLELNRYLEKWYNRPDGLSEVVEEYPGETLKLVSHSFWKEDYPKVNKRIDESLEKIDLSKIPFETQQRVIKKLVELSEVDPLEMTPERSINADLGLDSLDQAELLVFLEEQFSVTNVPAHELTTVGKLMAIASRQIAFKDAAEEDFDPTKEWKSEGPRKRLELSVGDTIPEVFLNMCDKMGNKVLCADSRSGILKAATFKLRVLILAEYIRKMPGKHIGILLPASVAAYATILACQLAGKVPVLLNWTVGPRHLKAVVEVSELRVVFSSWAFLDKLPNVDLSSIDDFLVMLEDVARDLTAWDKIKAALRAKRGAKSLLRLFANPKLQASDEAVLLFTSGTESLPKGVPLSHKNILSNMRGVIKAVDVYNDDVLFGILPPFHSFGFTISGLLPLILGVRSAFYPNPTQSRRLVKGVEKWGITIVCGAPTFLKNMLKLATPEQVKTLRLVITGAEKAPDELFSLAEELGIGSSVHEGYGITECAPVLTLNPPGKEARGVGLPLPGIELCIVNPENHVQKLTQGEQGLILARGPNVFSGYHRSDRNPFIKLEGEIWYDTGDLGYLDQDGYLTITGRQKRFIKIGSEMVSLAAIEDSLLRVAKDNDWSETVNCDGPLLAVCGREEPNEKPRLYLFTKFMTNVEEVNKALKKAGFSNLIRITHVRHLADIPIMGSGKINYRELESKYLTNQLM